MVEYVNIRKAFDVPVLRGVNLRIEGGETMAIVGQSGTGKSVLLKTTIGLIVPDQGNVRVDGERVFGGGRRAIDRVRRKVGYVFQNAALFDSITVYENITMGIPERELRRMRRREVTRRVGEALELVNLDPRLVMAKLPSELSGGMRKRAGLARVIVGRPSILLYDEPVTGLDPVNSAVVHTLIERLSDELHVTSIIVTHDVEGVLVISDHIAMLHEGRITFVGTPAEFRRSEDPMVRAFLARPEGADARDTGVA